MILRAALLLALLPVPALAQQLPPGYSRDTTVRGTCVKTGCDDFLITRDDPIARGPDGTLKHIAFRHWVASNSGVVERPPQEAHVYCSTTRPAVIATFGGKSIAYMLAPYSKEREPREVIGFYALYFTACHGLAVGKDASKEDARHKALVAQTLDYDVAIPRSTKIDLSRPEDILSSGPQGAPQRPQERAPQDYAPPAPPPPLANVPQRFEERFGREAPPPAGFDDGAGFEDEFIDNENPEDLRPPGYVGERPWYRRF